jgi:hypothetical protein
MCQVTQSNNWHFGVTPRGSGTNSCHRCHRTSLNFKPCSMARKHHETFQNNGILSYSGRLLHHNNNNNSCRKSWTRSEWSQHAGSQPRENEPVRSTVRSHGAQDAASCRLSDEASFTDQSNTNLCIKQSTFLYQSSTNFCTKQSTFLY